MTSAQVVKMSVTANDISAQNSTHADNQLSSRYVACSRLLVGGKVQNSKASEDWGSGEVEGCL